MVSALLFDVGKPAQAFFAALRDGEVLVSADTASELNDVLGRERFRRYVTEEEQDRFLRILLREASLIEIREKIRVCRAPKDDKFLELAVDGSSDCIVSGDEELLVLDPFRGIPILTPDKFLDGLPKDRSEEK